MNLSKYGFVLAGEWIEEANIRSGIAHKLTALSDDRVVFSFVVDKIPKYIGVCEKYTTTLQGRMRRFSTQQGAGANERISIKIKQALDQGSKVEIYALEPVAKLDFKGLKVDLVKGLVNPLIAKLKPEWNR